ncbi:MAG: DUF6265 family protein [Planctomycetota bacterium]
MKHAFLPLALLLCVPSFAEKDAAKIDSLAWLAGRWSGPMWGGEFVATYGAPAGGKLLSFSELRKGDTAAFYEFEVFEATPEGLVFTPYPRGQKKETFKLTSAEAQKAVFENPDKDFPTRIEYHRAAKDRLVITLSGGGGGKTETFDLKRVSD